MLNVFSAGQDLVRWEVTALGPEGPYRLAVYHPSGAIVEYFGSVPAALLRERELEDLLTIDHSMAEPMSPTVALSSMSPISELVH
jgi:hypothetical protein